MLVGVVVARVDGEVVVPAVVAEVAGSVAPVFGLLVEWGLDEQAGNPSAANRSGARPAVTARPARRRATRRAGLIRGARRATWPILPCRAWNLASSRASISMAKRSAPLASLAFDRYH